MDTRKKNKLLSIDACPHNGELLRNYFAEHNVNQTELAHQLDVSPAEVTHYLESQSLPLEILWKTSQVLKHNFVAELGEKIRVDYTTRREAELSQQVGNLQGELEKTKFEFSIYKNIVGNGTKEITEPMINVGILNANQVRFNLNGVFMASNGKTYEGKKIAICRKGCVLFDGDLYPELSFRPLTETGSFDVTEVTIGVGFHWERKVTQRFKGELRFVVDGGLIIVNRIHVEDYLTSVISSEMNAKASAELLKAHAVISRSWLLKPILNLPVETRHATSQMPIQQTGHATSLHIKWYERDAHTHFDVCADDHCQRYQGITRATKAVKAAIAATRGEVLMHGGAICDARFSKSCGGASETFENCWVPEHHPYLTKVIDNPTPPEGFETDLTVEENAEKWIRRSPEAFCNTTDKKVLSQVLNNYDQETTDFYRWQVEYTQAEISELLARRSGIDFGEILD
ncbi:MAG TPA: SpoIID/LytB domain-containing protein, partial [Paludibacter sp.]|nr:SpoIID/LytB domain-containing protein [Paludibacter sp.]